jgi:hypothetical protein
MNTDEEIAVIQYPERVPERTAIPIQLPGKKEKEAAPKTPEKQEEKKNG